MSARPHRRGGFVVLDDDGMVRFATDEAKRLLNRDELVGLELGIPITVDGFARVDIVGSEGPMTLTVTTVEGEWENEPALIAVLHEDLDERAPDTDWISVAGHEMNNPLSVIAGYAETLVDHHEQMDGEATRRAAEGILRQTGRLQRLVARLLAHSRSNAGLVQTQAEPVALSDLRESVDHDFPGVEFDLPTELFVVADRAHLQLVLDNLIENARRYGEPPIVVSAKTANDDMVRLFVRDHGDGVAPDFLDRLFEAFERGSGGRKSSGIGLGLSIVKRLVEANGGTIGYVDADGGGACFTIDLPRAKGNTDDG